MQQDKALRLVTLMADGIDPFTNKPLPEDHLLQNITISRALLALLRSVNQPTQQVTEATPEMKKRVTKKPALGPKWTSADVDTAISMNEEGKSNEEIGEALGRTSLSVKNKLGKIEKFGKPKFVSKTSADIPLGPKWTDEDVSTAVEMFQNGDSFEAIGESLERTSLSVKNKLRKLGKLNGKTSTKKQYRKKLNVSEEDDEEEEETQLPIVFKNGQKKTPPVLKYVQKKEILDDEVVSAIKVSVNFDDDDEIKQKKKPVQTLKKKIISSDSG